MEHAFTETIKGVLRRRFGAQADDVFERSLLLQYVNLKTRAASRGSKSRSSFANLYALYVLVEDYLAGGFDKKGDYSKYEGAVFTKLFQRQRQLPFGSKLQNHALNDRLNGEFRKFFPTCEFTPIVRDVQTNRYWINLNLLRVRVGRQSCDLAASVIAIIDAYIQAKRTAFDAFIQTCLKLKTLTASAPSEAEAFILDLLAPNRDARLFEIVSFAILKFFYHDQTIYFGHDLKHLVQERLRLFKTGRTNANDGGIDFVMKPLGRFFQVTETLDVKKYFLDIDKIERYPISFVIKSDDPIPVLREKLEAGARKQFGVQRVVASYMACIEEIINLPVLRERFLQAKAQGCLPAILDEIVKQSKVEFNYAEETDAEGDDEEEETLSSVDVKAS
ncbi:MAG: restriction endonuclease [Verrucomicrobia bacterium]|nr:restriction endonuclease [Verrucomicrobiota bacterium]